MRFRYKSVKIYTSYIIFYKYYTMVSSCLFNLVGRCRTYHIEFTYSMRTLLMNHFKHLYKNLCCSIGIITSSVVIFKRHSKLFTKPVQCKLAELRHKHMSKCHGINYCIIKWQSLPFRKLFYKACIKTGIVGYHYGVTDIIQEFRKYSLNGRRFLNHSIIDRCKFGYAIWYSHLRINKSVICITNFSIFNSYCAYLNYLIMLCTKTGCLYIKYNIFRIDALSLII